MNDQHLKYKHILNIGIASLTALSLGACSNQQTVNFSVLKESSQCRTPHPKISQLSTSQEQDNLIRSMSSFKGQTKQNALIDLIQTHAKSESLFLISQGQKPTTGYGFTILSNTGSLIENTLTLPITFTSPEPGSMRAQMITNPCLVIGIDSKAQYDLLLIDNLELSISK
tara:strand:+ start:5075 stop:5584 length:510 start_codon:yes stop_codon:yes gene_type:complete